MRCYHVCNMYLGGIQAGIQSAHVQHELANLYAINHGQAADLYRSWASNHKTIILLNGGYQSNLQRFVQITRNQNHLPWAAFHEEQDALNGALTNVGIVLPQEMYGEHAAAIHLMLDRPDVVYVTVDQDTIERNGSTFVCMDQRGELKFSYTRTHIEIMDFLKPLRLMS